MDVLAYALAKKYADSLAISGGIKYMGSKPTAADLPAASAGNKGHMYTISGQSQPDYGHEYVSDGTQWVDLGADLNNKQDKLIAGENITIAADGKTISAAGSSSPECVTLSFYDDGDTGTLTDAQAQVLLASELNYIWLNGMHRLDFRYRDNNNNKATYSAVDTSSDGNKTHSVEINLTTKAFTVYHRTLQELISDLATIRSGAALGATAIQQHQDISGKLNVLPKVDDPTDPGFGWEYHIPYRFDVALDAEKADIDLHTLTLDNKLTKMVFNKQIPAASTTVAGLMSAADKVALDGKQDKLIEGSGIKLEGNTISADVRTYKAFPSSWPHTSGTTIAQFCAAVNASYKAGEIAVGDAFLGNVNSQAFFNGAYIEGGGSLGSAEVSVQIMTPFGQNCVQLLTTTSSNNAPYHWEYTYVDGATSEGWRCWSQHSYVNDKLSLKQDTLTPGENITIKNNVISATGGSAPDAYLSDASVDADNNLKIQNKNGQDIVNCTVNYTLTNDKVKAVLTDAEKETLLSGVTATTWVAANANIAANTSALGGLKFVALTQAQYDALATKDASTLYIIKNA